MTLKGGVDATLLRRGLRLVHCLQKERGAACSYVASNNASKDIRDLAPTRFETDRALKMLEQSIAYTEAKRAIIDVSLEKIRNMLLDEHLHGTDSHRVLLCFNTLISAVTHDYILEQTAFQRSLQTEEAAEAVFQQKSIKKMPRVRSQTSLESMAAPKHRRNLSDGFDGSVTRGNRARLASDPLQAFLQNVEEEKDQASSRDEHPHLARIPSQDSSDETVTTHPSSSASGVVEQAPALYKQPESKPSVSFWLPTKDEAYESNQETVVQLLDMLDAFVILKESTGRERAILSSILIAGQTDAARYLVNDLALEVENQKRRLEQLKTFKTKTSLQNLVQEVVALSPFLLSLQSRILTGFDTGNLEAVVYSPEELWNMLTVYIDKLHALELMIVEELECTAFSITEMEQVFDPPKTTMDLKEDLLKDVFGDNFDSQDDLYEHVKNLTPEMSKKKLLSLLRQRSSMHGSVHSYSSMLSGSYAKDGAVTTEGLPNRLDGLIQELSAVPQSSEWEIDLYKIRFLKRIGQGNAGTTYLGEWEGSRVAVKVAAISEMGLEGWRTEVRALQKLHHPNIIRLLGSVYHLDPLTFCLVLEYCGGGDLSDALDRTTPKGFFFRSSRGIAKGVAYLHSRGCIHRDIKPSNVLLDGDVKTGDFEVKVTDFGVSTEYSAQPQNRTAETGTYRWMAPEVIRHENYSSPADVYSFGVLVWQLLTRETPFADKSTFDAAATVAMEQGRPPFPDNTPAPIRELIESCWAHNPDERPTFDEIVATLTKLEKEMSEDEKKWLDAPLGHKVYAKPVPIIPKPSKRVQLQVPVTPGCGAPGEKQVNREPKKRFSLFSRKSSHF